VVLFTWLTTSVLHGQAPTSNSDASSTGELKAGEPLNPLSMQWPRTFATNGYEFAVYQPQISKWPGNQLDGRFAIAARPAGTTNETYGVVFFSARTDIDKANRLVTLEDFKVTKVNFPTSKKLQNAFQPIIQSELPKSAKIIPLDHLEAVFAASGDIEKVKMQQVLNTPPHLIYTTQPSLLVQIDCSPILKPLVVNYERVINTRAILLLNTNTFSQGYYLYAASNWYSAPSIQGPWAVNPTPPGDISTALDAALATKQVDPAFPRATNAPVPVIYVATTPSELLETSGVANLLSIPGTDLLYVENSDQSIFYFLDDGSYYVLISGRWFKCPSLYGPWTYVAAAQLPADFKKIPPDSPKSNVLLSVPGTPQAQEAVIASTIPQTTTIYRDKAKLTLDYIGAPSWVAIPGTSLFYAANTMTPVIMVNSKNYYACQGGVWFVSSSATGPWSVATSVPAAIYTIPPSSPIHYVTYVYVYGYTPTVVYVGYTPGYMGVIISSSGVVVYGTGYTYTPVIVGTTCVSYPPTYSSGASLAMGAAVGFAFGYCAGHSSSCYYEPYWGCYHYSYPYHYGYAGYNVNSASYYSHWGTAYRGGSYGYNAYTGNAWANQHASTYNPYTGARGSTYAAGAGNAYTGNYAAGRTSAGYNPTTGRSYAGTTTTSGNIYSGNYSATHQTDYSNEKTGTTVNSRSTVTGNAYNGSESWNSAGTAYNSKTGNSAAWANGNMAVDRNGNTYTTFTPTKDTATAASQAQSDWSSRQSSAQSTGQQRFDNFSRSGGGGWGGGDRSFGGGGWSRGGGGFRR
jgi:hypothetical protein